MCSAHERDREPHTMHYACTVYTGTGPGTGPGPVPVDHTACVGCSCAAAFSDGTPRGAGAFPVRGFGGPIRALPGRSRRVIIFQMIFSRCPPLPPPARGPDGRRTLSSPRTWTCARRAAECRIPRGALCGARVAPRLAPSCGATSTGIRIRGHLFAAGCAAHISLTPRPQRHAHGRAAR